MQGQPPQLYPPQGPPQFQQPYNPNMAQGGPQGPIGPQSGYPPTGPAPGLNPGMQYQQQRESTFDFERSLGNGTWRSDMLI